MKLSQRIKQLNDMIEASSDEVYETAFDVLEQYGPEILAAVEAMEQRKCPMGDDCDLVVAYMKGVADGRDRIKRDAAACQEAVNKIGDKE